MNKRNRGAFYEEAVKEYLIRQNVVVLYQNYYCHYGEIDLIAKEQDTAVFFEIKYRKDNRYGLPEEAVTKSKQRHICKCAEWFLMNHTWVKSIRYDVIAIEGKEIRWIRNAFEHIGYRTY